MFHIQNQELSEKLIKQFKAEVYKYIEEHKDREIQMTYSINLSFAAPKIKKQSFILVGHGKILVGNKYFYNLTDILKQQCKPQCQHRIKPYLVIPNTIFASNGTEDQKIEDQFHPTTIFDGKTLKTPNGDFSVDCEQFIGAREGGFWVIGKDKFVQYIYDANAHGSSQFRPQWQFYAFRIRPAICKMHYSTLYIIDEERRCFILHGTESRENKIIELPILADKIKNAKTQHPVFYQTSGNNFVYMYVGLPSRDVFTIHGIKYPFKTKRYQISRKGYNQSGFFDIHGILYQEYIYFAMKSQQYQEQLLPRLNELQAERIMNTNYDYLCRAQVSKLPKPKKYRVIAGQYGPVVLSEYKSKYYANKQDQAARHEIIFEQ